MSSFFSCARARSLSWAALATLVACSAPSQGPARRTPGSVATGTAGAPAASDAVIAENQTCAADNPFCAKDPIITASPGTGGPLIGTTKNCGSAPLDLRPTGVNIMLAVDGSAVMKKAWSNIATAIRSLRQNNPTAAFGMHRFWADPVDPVADGEETLNHTNNGCKTYHNEVLDLGDHTADELVTFLGSGPQGGSIYESYQVGPVLTPLNMTYLLQATPLADPSKTNYLVVFTSANENCFGSAFVSAEDKLLAFQKLAIELHKRNIRLIPVGIDEPMTQTDATGFGPGLIGTTVIGDLHTDYTLLETMLKYGGADNVKEVPRVDTPAKLAQLVSDVGQAVNNCRFEIPGTLDASKSVNAFEIDFSINGMGVPRDRAQANGWNFVKGSTSQVEFFGQACEALQSGLTVEANKSCSADVCGTAAVSVSTKPRRVLLLLDSSASRIECADGTTNCLAPPGSDGRTLTFWEVVQHAVGNVLIAPVNGEVQFGMQFFPDKNADGLSCNVASMPEIPAAPGTQIEIMKQMLEKLPFGMSPDVGIMESVATAPGNLDESNVVGAVVLLSDGGDNCSGDMQPQIVARLGAAAKSLHGKGIRTFAVRYGSKDGETADQAEQLTVIAKEGGTALAGAALAYIDAKSPMELGDALAGISDQLASCVFTLGNIAAGVDRSRTNLFLDGEQIGFDATSTKQEGWSWIDPAQTTIELYGSACTQFKTSLDTNIIVEFGCEQVVIAPD